MKPEFLASCFEVLGDTPETIRRLRKLIVSLAVVGKLASDDEAISTPDQLRMQLAAERDVLIKAGRLRGQNPSTEVSDDDLPAGFCDPARFVKLGQIARIEKGETGIQQARPGGYPLVVTAAERLTCDHFDFDGAAAIIPLVSSAGHGKASLQRLHYQEGRFALGSILAAVFPHAPKLTTPRFLYEYLTAFKDELLVSRMIGTANVALSIGKIADVPVPLVAPAAQARVDELMALCDQLEEARSERERRRDRLAAASLARLKVYASESFQADASFALEALPFLTSRLDQIRALRQTILNLAMRGKLVPEDEGISVKEVELESLVKIVRGSSPRPKGDSRYYGGPVPRLLIADITRDGKYVVPKLDNLTLEGAKLSRPMPAKSLVLAISGSYGVPAFLAVDACIHDGFIGFRDVDPRIDPEYLYLVMLFRRPYFDEVVKDSGLKNLTTEHLKRLSVPLPPLAEQHRIVARVDELMALCDQIEAALTAADSASARLLDAILHEALNGAPVAEAA